MYSMDRISGADHLRHDQNAWFAVRPQNKYLNGFYRIIHKPLFNKLNDFEYDELV
jgi:hypothetical protein